MTTAQQSTNSFPRSRRRFTQSLKISTGLPDYMTSCEEKNRNRWKKKNTLGLYDILWTGKRPKHEQTSIILKPKKLENKKDWFYPSNKGTIIDGLILQFELNWKKSLWRKERETWCVAKTNKLSSDHPVFPNNFKFYEARKQMLLIFSSFSEMFQLFLLFLE